MSVIVFFIMSRVVRPITTLSGKLHSVVAGDISVVLATNERDEVGDLSRNITKVVDNFISLEKDLSKLTDEINRNGDILYKHAGLHVKCLFFNPILNKIRNRRKLVKISNKIRYYYSSIPPAI
jgi:methyl-accepting chemotaxis protein